MAKTARDAIFESFINIIIVANLRGKYFADSLAHALESRLVSWNKELFSVDSIDQASVVILAGDDVRPVEDVLVKINTASQNHYLKWLPLQQRWGLVELNWNADGGWAHDVITTEPNEIAGNVVGGMLASHEALEVGDYAARDLMEAPDVDPDLCFLCNQRPSTTEEHVFPRWLQRDFDLWNKRVGLLNETMFKYGSLTVPACQRCNTIYLREIEDRVCDSVREGYHIAKHLGDMTVFQWLGKIFLGLLVKQTQLKLNLSDPNDTRTILSTNLFKGINTLRKWLSSVYRPVTFEKPLPWVTYVLHMQDEPISFNYCDSISELSFMIQMGNVGIILVAMDHLARADKSSANHQLHDRLTEVTYGRLIRDQIKDHPLHPLQLIELYCRITYQHSRATIPPAFRFKADLTKPTYDRLEVGNTAVPFEMEGWEDEAIYRGTQAIAASVGFRLQGGGSWLLDENSNFVKYTDDNISSEAI